MSENNTRYRLAPDLLMRKFDETGLLVNLESDQVYELNETGFRVVELLDGARSLDDLLGLLAAEYDAEAASLRPDVEALIDQLLAQGLIVTE